MPVAVAIQTGSLSTFLAFGNWGGGRALGSSRMAPIVRPESAPARVIDIAPETESPAPSIAYRKVLAYSRPARSGEAPQLWMSSMPSGQTIDVTV